MSHSPHSTASALKSWAKKHVRIVHFTLMVSSPNLAPHSHQLHIHQCRCPVVLHGEALEGLRKHLQLISRSQKFGHIPIRPYCDFEVLIGISHRTHLGVIVVMSTMLLGLCKLAELILGIGAESLGNPASLVTSDAIRANLAL